MAKYAKCHFGLVDDLAFGNNQSVLFVGLAGVV